MRQTFPDEAIWANDAPEIDDPDATIYRTAYESGAGKTPPKAGVHNYLFRRSDEQHQHIERNGVPRWDPRTIYVLGGWCLASDHNLYRSRVAGNVNHDPLAANGDTYWRSMTSVSLERVFEVGSMVMRPTNPGAPESQGGLGFGTWVKISGRSPIGEGSYTDSRGESRSFNRGSSTGEYRHRLTVPEMPRHTHKVKEGTSQSITSGSGEWLASGDDYTRQVQYYSTSGETGEGEPHNVMHPVFVVPMWYRTA
ncbi:phage baseplate protein [Alloalcanivorax xenomutans]